MTKIAVVGANSYIARNLIEMMRQKPEEYTVWLYDYAPSHADGCMNYTSINILEESSVDKIDFSCDVLFMFIGKTGSADGFEKFDLFIDINERALLYVLNSYRKQNSKAKIIFPSTRLVYKGQDCALKEDAQKEFKTIYAINKFSCEQYLEMYHRVFGIEYCIFRICIPYGTMIAQASSYGTAEFMLEKAKQGQDITLYGKGDVRRTLTYMEDLCEILLKGARSEKCVNDVFNIGGEAYSLLEMAQLIAEQYSVKVSFVPWPEVAERIESGSTVFDSEKLESIIGQYSYHKFEAWCKNQIAISK